MTRNLYPEKLQLFLDTFIRRMELLNRADNPRLVARIVTKWTQEQTLLTKNLLQYVLQSESRINEGEEASAVEKIIRNRLLKEFKQDELTLNIRRKIYQKDVENLSEIRSGKLEPKDWLFLAKIQKKLGLTDKQARLINNDKITLNDYLSLNYSDEPTLKEDAMSPAGDDISCDGAYKVHTALHRQTVPYEPKRLTAVRDTPSDISFRTLGSDRYKNSIHKMSLVSAIGSASWNTAEICEQSELITQSFYESAIENQSKNPFRLKWLLLFLWTPFLFLSLKGINIDWTGENQSIAIEASNLEQQKLCVDLSSRQSPRMSLGEKLLTEGKKYSQLDPAAVMASYEGMAAFARCEFSAAQNKYRQSIGIDKNNPEALIYHNNAKAIAQDHFKIAVSVPLGNKPDIAWEILRGVAQAQTEFNRQGGINNKPLLVQIVNDDNDPYVVEQLAKQLAADKSILAVVGHNDSNSSIAGAKIYEEEELVMISPTSTSTKLSGIGSHIMRTIPSVSALAGKLADYASAKSFTKIAVCSDSQDSASGSFAREFETQVTMSGAQIQQLNCDFARQDFQPDSIVSQAIAVDADALLLAPSVNKMERAIAVAKANQQRLPLLGNHSLYTYKTIESGQNATAGMVIPSPWLSEENRYSNFPKMAMQYWGGKVNWRTAMTYDAVKAIALGLKQGNNRSDLQSALTQADFTVDGVTGKFQFERGDRLGQIQLARIQKSNAGDKYQFSQLEL